MSKGIKILKRKMAAQTNYPQLYNLNKLYSVRNLQCALFFSVTSSLKKQNNYRNQK